MYAHKSLAFALLAFLAACGGNEPDPLDQLEEPARFADASETERIAAAVAGIGYLPALAYVSTIGGVIDSIASDNECPAETVNADGTLTYEADECTGPSGSSYDGSFTAENLPDLFSEEVPEGPLWVDFQGWEADGLVVDGELWQSEVAPTTTYTMRTDLSVTLPGLPTVSAAHDATCELGATSTTCESDEAAIMVVEGLGDFLVDGPWTTGFDGVPSGSVALVGEDTLTLDLGAMDTETGCIPATIDGEAIDPICVGALYGEAPTGPTVRSTRTTSPW